MITPEQGAAEPAAWAHPRERAAPLVPGAARKKAVAGAAWAIRTAAPSCRAWLPSPSARSCLAGGGDKQIGLPRPKNSHLTVYLDDPPQP
jgi:hypothetical protein